MRQRVEQLIGRDAKGLWIGTFHSLFARILRKEAAHLGYPSDFSIYDDADSKSLIRLLIKELGLDDKVYKPNIVLARISGAKNRLISAQAYTHNHTLQEEDAKAMKPRVGELFLRYANRCYKAGAMDFDDLLFQTYRLFQEQGEVLHRYQEQFRYILIDEFQDTNMVQYGIVRYLAQSHQNICVVGDDAQSIYAFRGADIHNMLHFERDYPTLQYVKLEQNYRSTQCIVQAANAIISHNKAQFQKNVWTENELGDQLDLIHGTTDTEESKLVVSSILSLKLQQQSNNKDFAVLYRTNSQSRSMEEALRKADIPYRVVGGMSFYQRKEVKDLLAYLRLLVNPYDEEAFRRVVNLPKRGIGANSMDKVRQVATQQGIPFWEVVGSAQKWLGSRIGQAMENFHHLIQQTRKEMDEQDAYTVALHIAKRSGLLRDMHADKTVEGLGRYENMQELFNGIKEFTTENEGANVSMFLQQVALSTNADEEDKGEARVTLMTIHAAKGLEFPYVYVVGMEEELFPSQLMLGSQEDLEEERRLFYVAVTRAKPKVFLSYASSRYRFGRLKYCQPSRFLREVGAKHWRKPLQPTGTTTQQSSTAYAHRLVRGLQSRRHKPPMAATGDFHQVDLTQLQTGTQIEHPRFGRGVITQLDVAANKVTVRFQEFGRKILLLNFARLRVLQP